MDRNRLMKILITTDLFLTPTNGVVTSVRNLREELVKKGHEVHILTLSGNLCSYQEDGVYYIKSVPLQFIYPAVRMPVSYRNPFLREIQAWKPDVIHSQCEFFSFRFALQLSKELDIPLVHTYHTLYEQYVNYVIPSRYLGSCAVRFLSRKRLEQVAKIIAPTKKVEDALLDYGLPNPICIVPSGISLEQHKQRMPQAERLQKRRALGIQDGCQVLLSLGRLGAEKNLEELLELFAAERNRNGNVVFLIVGDGPDREHLERKARELGVKDHVVFTGMVSPGQVQTYYQLGDVFVSASTSESQGLTYVEAAANGLPLLCREDPCLNDVIQEGVNGYQYTSPKDFLDKLNIVLQDANWRKNAGAHSEQIAESFDKGSFAAAIEAVYQSVLA